MHGNKIDMISQFRILHPGMPRLGGADRSGNFLACAIQIGKHFFDRYIVTQQHFVTDDHTYHIPVLRQLDGAIDFLVIVFEALVYPRSDRHIDFMLGRQFRDLSEYAFAGIGTHRMDFTFQHRQVSINFFGARRNTGDSVLIFMIGRKGNALQGFRPRGFHDRLV